MDWPLTDAHSADIGAVDASTSLPTSVASGAVANTKGSWVELIASTSRPGAGIYLIIPITVAATSQNRSSLIDIGIGPNGSERVLVPNINLGMASGPRAILIPIYVPAGSRLSVRHANATVPISIAMQLVVMHAGRNPLLYAGTRATDYGTVTASSGGPQLTAPGSINTKSAWTELVAATSYPMRWLIPFVTPVNSGNNGAADYLVDIGVGASGSERAVVSNLVVRTTTNEEALYAPIGYPVRIPAGVRLAARFQSSTQNANYGLRATVIGIG